MSFSDLVHAVESDVSGALGKVEKLLPAGLPSDTREVAALAEDAEKVAVTLDPELEPIFQAIGSVGNTIEGALHELGVHVGTLKKTLATRAAAAVALPPLAVPPAAQGAAPVGTPDPAAPQPAATDPNPLPAGAPPAAESTAPSSEPTPSTTEPPAGSADPSTEPAPLSNTPGEADPNANPVPEAVPAVVADPALSEAEAAFAGLSPEDKAAFEAAEGLEATPPPDATPPA